MGDRDDEIYSYKNFKHCRKPRSAYRVDLMAHLSVSEAADRLGVHVQRVHQRIADGSLPAERVGRQWVIRESDLARVDKHRAGRPLSRKSAWEVALVASGIDAVAVRDDHIKLVECKGFSMSAPDRSRARSRLQGFLGRALNAHDESDPEAAASYVAANLRSLLRGRADRRSFRASNRDLEDLRADDRVQLSGVSLPESGISAGDVIEGYVASSQLEALVADFLLSEARDDDANVVLHVVPPQDSSQCMGLAQSWMILAADLAEHHRPREVARAAEIVCKAAERVKPISEARVAV